MWFPSAPSPVSVLSGNFLDFSPIPPIDAGNSSSNLVPVVCLYGQDCKLAAASLGEPEMVSIMQASACSLETNLLSVPPSS